MTVSDTNLVLIRHGESRAQVDGILSGHDTCIGLSPKGKQQAVALRTRLAASRELDSTDSLYTSVLPRAIETAAIIAPALPDGLEARQECSWCEIHVGEAEGVSWDRLDELFPRRGEPDDPEMRRFPGSETWAEFGVRVATRLDRIADEHAGEHTAVVCHGGVVAASFVAFADVPMARVSELARATTNTSITEWRHQRNGWRLIRFNDASHLS